MHSCAYLHELHVVENIFLIFESGQLGELLAELSVGDLCNGTSTFPVAFCDGVDILVILDEVAVARPVTGVLLDVLVRHDFGIEGAITSFPERRLKSVGSVGTEVKSERSEVDTCKE